MGEEFRISEVLQAGGIVGHCVGLPWDVLGHMTVAVLALVLSRKDALLGRRSVGGNCFLVHLGFSRGVVHEGGNGDAADRVSHGNGAHLGKDAGVLDVTVHDGAVLVVCRHEFVLDFRREHHLPHMGVSLCAVAHSSHASLGGISGAQTTRILRDKWDGDQCQPLGERRHTGGLSAHC